MRGAVCVDVGASTGGFTDVLLRAGAKHVYAVDVGYNLLDYRLRSDARVTAMERVNARFLRAEDFPERAVVRGDGCVVYLPEGGFCPRRFPVLEGPNRRFVALVKPQFEAAREGRGGEGRRAGSHRYTSACWRRSLLSCPRWAGGARVWIFPPFAARREI